jgi:hypothetical protein
MAAPLLNLSERLTSSAITEGANVQLVSPFDCIQFDAPRAYRTSALVKPPPAQAIR